MLLDIVATNTLNSLSEPWWKVIYDFSSLTKWIDTSLHKCNVSILDNCYRDAYYRSSYSCCFMQLSDLFLVYAERKVCAFMQNRLGPNRIGPFGIFQTIADLVKLLFKELIPIKNADKFLFNLAPFIVIIASFHGYCCNSICKRTACY